MTAAYRVALVCFAAAAAWPLAVSLLSTLMLSPFERAMRVSWCGAPIPDMMLAGHCAACWTGSAMFTAVGLALLATARQRHPAVIRR